jgi:hypothetical protein
VFNVGIIKIILRTLLTKNNLFPFKFVISNFWQFFLLFTFFFEFALFSIFFPNKNCPSLGKFETKKTCWLWARVGGGVRGWG